MCKEEFSTIVKMAIVEESYLTSVQESESKVFKAQSKNEIVRKKLWQAKYLDGKIAGHFRGRTHTHMDFIQLHENCFSRGKMWNVVNTMGHPTQIMGPTHNHKREFSSFRPVPSVPIVPGKSFTNPNFVNKHYPSKHCFQNKNNFTWTPLQNISHFDGCKVDGPKTSTNSSLLNSSQSIVDTVKEKNLDVLNTIETNQEVQKTEPIAISSTRKPKKRNRRNRRKKADKNKRENNTRQQINDMMDVDTETDLLSTSCGMASPHVLNNVFCLADFVVETNRSRPMRNKPNQSSVCSEEPILMPMVISISPPISRAARERQLSTTDSEDSFIVFDSGTDEELEFSEQSDEETESDDEAESDSGEDEVDATSSVIPCKKVRFADDADLCEIHPMVQWSFAYRESRKGPWVEYARDRDRFKRRIQQTEEILLPIFDPRHRENIYKDRFIDSINVT